MLMRHSPINKPDKKAIQEQTDKITRKVAIAFVFVACFFFIVKILFL